MILETKLHRPRPTPDLVCRLRLHERMDAGAPGRAILVAAPAGYGKSMLVSHWAELRPEPCAWLALDESDNDFAVFLEYLIAAVRMAIPDVCPETHALLRAADLPPVQRLAHSLVNELDAIETPFLLVLDDLHNISDRAIFELLDLLLKHPPRSLVLVLVTRRDPPLELPVLLARGQLVEMRLRDLVFEDPETETLLKRVAGISVSAEALAKLQTKVEGWAVGLRLILLILRDRHDPDEFLMGLEGDYGGFGGVDGVQTTWNALALVGYRFKPKANLGINVFAGYRYLYIDYKKVAAIELAIKGAFLGVAFEFDQK